MPRYSLVTYPKFPAREAHDTAFVRHAGCQISEMSQFNAESREEQVKSFLSFT